MARRAKVEVEVTGDTRGFAKAIDETQRIVGGKFKSALVGAFSLSATTRFSRELFKTTKEITEVARKYEVTNAQAQQLIAYSERNNIPLEKMAESASSLEESLRNASNLPVIFSDEDLNSIRDAQLALQQSKDEFTRDVGPAIAGTISAAATGLRFMLSAFTDRWNKPTDLSDFLPRGPGDTETEGERAVRLGREAKQRQRDDVAAVEKENAEALVKLAEMEEKLELRQLSAVEKRARFEQAIEKAKQTIFDLSLRAGSGRSLSPDEAGALIEARKNLAEAKNATLDLDAKEKQEKLSRLQVDTDSLARIGGFVGGSASNKTEVEILKQITELRRDLIAKGIKVAEL